MKPDNQQYNVLWLKWGVKTVDWISKLNIYAIKFIEEFWFLWWATVMTTVPVISWMNWSDGCFVIYLTIF